MVMPSILSTLKACKIISPFHHHDYHSSFYPVTGVSGTGSDLASYAGQGSYDSYSKDWSANQRRTRWA